MNSPRYSHVLIKQLAQWRRCLSQRSCDLSHSDNVLSNNAWRQKPDENSFKRFNRCK